MIWGADLYWKYTNKDHPLNITPSTEYPFPNGAYQFDCVMWEHFSTPVPSKVISLEYSHELGVWGCLSYVCPHQQLHTSYSSEVRVVKPVTCWAWQETYVLSYICLCHHKRYRQGPWRYAVKSIQYSGKHEGGSRIRTASLDSRGDRQWG